MFGSVVAIALTCSPNILGAIADKDFTGEGFTLTQRAKSRRRAARSSSNSTTRPAR
ncbi:MAG: hypothetical protein GQE15_38125 [Archangiaceae bacterium]|nr:hypothetical protein [Archangiaceae bacterium]